MFKSMRVVCIICEHYYQRWNKRDVFVKDSRYNIPDYYRSTGQETPTKLKKSLIC